MIGEPYPSPYMTETLNVSPLMANFAPRETDPTQDIRIHSDGECSFFYVAHVQYVICTCKCASCTCVVCDALRAARHRKVYLVEIVSILSIRLTRPLRWAWTADN